MPHALKLAQADNGLWFLNGHVTVAVSKAESADGISVLEHTLRLGDAPPLHIHHMEDEFFIMLEGEMRFRVGDRSFVRRSGDRFFAPRGVPHGYRVTSAEGARLITLTRGGFENMVVAVSRPAEHGGLPDFAVPTPQMQQALAAACAAEQIELVGPPLE